MIEVYFGNYLDIHIRSMLVGCDIPALAGVLPTTIQACIRKNCSHKCCPATA